MVIAVFGESCTGKSTIADFLKSKLQAQVYIGKDYLKFDKNQDTSRTIFINTLKEYETKKDRHIIYVISEKVHLDLVPFMSFRILVTADIQVIKDRFRKRLNGSLPAPVEKMLETKHGMFDSEKNDLHIKSGSEGIEEIGQKIITLIKSKSL